MSDVLVFVEVPSGSRNKYELDAETGHIVLDRGELDQALAYMLGTVVLGLLAVWAGLRVGQAF